MSEEGTDGSGSTRGREQSLQQRRQNRASERAGVRFGEPRTHRTPDRGARPREVGPSAAAATWFIVTCEHGGNRIPARYQPLFRDHADLLASHEAYDPGALALARDFAWALHAEIVYSRTSRLLIELNRSPSHVRLFSLPVRSLPPAERARLLVRYYEPYRARIVSRVAAAVAAGERALHLSSHSFTPRLNGHTRRADVGLLYDPRREREARFCLAWQAALRTAQPELVVRRNYPYRGSADGLTTSLRRRFGEAAYLGIEVEVNQKYPLGEPAAWRRLRALLVFTLQRVLAH